MILLFTRSWQHVLTRGIVTALFGAAALMWPVLSVRVLVTLFGFYVVLAGLTIVVAALRGRRVSSGSAILLAQGVISLAAGAAALIWPGITAVVLLIVVAGWAIATGAMEIIMAIALRKEIQGEWMLILAGAVSVVFGIVLGLNPDKGIVAMAWLLGGFALIRGIVLMLLSNKLRGLRNWAEEESKRLVAG